MLKKGGSGEEFNERSAWGMLVDPSSSESTAESIRVVTGSSGILSRNFKNVYLSLLEWCIEVS